MLFPFSFFLNDGNLVSVFRSTEQEELVRSLERSQAQQILLWRVNLTFTISFPRNFEKSRIRYLLSGI